MTEKIRKIESYLDEINSIFYRWRVSKGGKKIDILEVSCTLDSYREESCLSINSSTRTAKEEVKNYLNCIIKSFKSKIKEIEGELERLEDDI
jgi:hypothetical protein